jgi:hypothetical protein
MSTTQKQKEKNIVFCEKKIMLSRCIYGIKGEDN